MDRKLARRRSYAVLLITICVVLLMYIGYTSSPYARIVSTDDAYVGGKVFKITSREPGFVNFVHVDDNQYVQPGQVLVDFDSAVADEDVARAEAELAYVTRSVVSDLAKVTEGDAAIKHAQILVERTSGDLKRRREAAEGGAVSQEDNAHAADEYRTALVELSLARARRNEAAALVAGTNVYNNPRVLAAAAAVKRAYIARSHLRLRAPVGGVVVLRSVEAGQQVERGAQLLSIVPLEGAWVDANFRETQLADLKVGQPATITADIYGAEIRYHGRVSGFAAGTGSAFALLPPQNASGNWIKITQRLPVRIALDARELHAHPLRLGLSVQVEIDTGRISVAGGPGSARANWIRDAHASDVEITNRPGSARSFRSE